MAKKKNINKSVSENIDLSRYEQILADRGTETKSAIINFKLHERDREPLFSLSDNFFEVLNSAFSSEWKDGEISKVIIAIDQQIRTRQVEVKSLERWIKFHVNDSEAVSDCMMVLPPKEVIIQYRLPRTGSQKLVFIANWQFAQREVVLKCFLDGNADKLIPRELQTHALSMEHPNIIKTHVLSNKEHERFLVEARLQEVLHDRWRSHGVGEAANLLRDMASALAFLKDKRLIHGDIKPDNIGFEDNNYILLDFGICRPEESFADDPTATGSLRTRAPEILLSQFEEASENKRSTHTHASDIWALGASVFNSLAGRFPLFGEEESPPRISEPEKRRDFEKELVRRIEEEWESKIDFSLIPDQMREILCKTLELDPAKRVTASDLVKEAEKELVAYLRTREGVSRFSPEDEINQLKSYLPVSNVLALMPINRRHMLEQRLDILYYAHGLESQRDVVKELGMRINKTWPEQA